MSDYSSASPINGPKAAADMRDIARETERTDEKLKVLRKEEADFREAVYTFMQQQTEFRAELWAVLEENGIKQRRSTVSATERSFADYIRTIRRILDAPPSTRVMLTCFFIAGVGSTLTACALGIHL